MKIKILTQKFFNALFSDNDKDLEPVSDDEIYLSQTIEPITNTQARDTEEISEDEQQLEDKQLINKFEPIIIEESEFNIDDIQDNNKKIKTVEQHPPERISAHRNRPIQLRKQRNKKNNTHRMRRYQHYIINLKCRW